MFPFIVFRGEVILDLQKFQIQPMDTLNTEHLQLLILTANPTTSGETIGRTSSDSFHESSQAEAPSLVTETAVIAEEAGLFVQVESTTPTLQVESTTTTLLASSHDVAPSKAAADGEIGRAHV